MGGQLGGRFTAVIKFDGCKHSLGGYPTKVAAAAAYDDASDALKLGRPNNTVATSNVRPEKGDGGGWKSQLMTYSESLNLENISYHFV